MPLAMARGNARAPSQHAYRGSIGRTQTKEVHVTGPKGELVVGTVYTTIDAVSDPDLVERLHADDLSRALNVVRPEGGQPIRLAIPVVYHDPAAEVLVLVLDEAHRHREIEERIALLERLRDDAAPVPAYAKDFAVVFGTAGLRAYLEDRAHQALAAARSQDSSKDERRRAELAAREVELDRERKELDKIRADVERNRQEIERLRADARSRVIAAVTEQTTISPPPEPPRVIEPGEREELVTAPVGRQELSGAAKLPAPVVAPAPAKNGKHVEFDVEEETTDTGSIPQGADPLTTETLELPPHSDPWLEFAATAPSSTFQVDADGSVRLALIAGDQLARALGGPLDVRVLLHRAPTSPVVALLIGPPAALRVPSPTQIAVLPLDIGVELELQVLTSLSKRFELVIDLIHHGQSTRRVRVSAPLAENVAFILRAAEDHLRGLTADGEAEPSFQRARDLVTGAGYDLLGLEHGEASEFRDDKLAEPTTAQAVRRAIAIARRFARPSREDYLVCARGYPLARWRELRRIVLERAVSWGIWMGPELAQVAVSEGLARSRRDLIAKLGAGREVLAKHPTANDIDADAAADNAKAILEEAKALGVELQPGDGNARAKSVNGAIKSEDVSTVSGQIERTPTSDVARPLTVEELIAQLEDKDHRVAAASELCDRGEGQAAAAVIAAVKKMSRAEAVRILGKCIKLGDAAAPPLIEGLASSKAFLRHGCALALALLRTDRGSAAVIDLLLAEPTEIWREVARAIGQIGPTALLPLASQVGKLGAQLTPGLQERVAWAMAHVGVRGGKSALDQMAVGESVVAPVAAQALTLLDTAARDEIRVRPGAEASKDVTVNRAFSRRFFEALEGDRPDGSPRPQDASTPLETLDEADLIVEEDEEAELDESDLIQS